MSDQSLYYFQIADALAEAREKEEERIAAEKVSRELIGRRRSVEWVPPNWPELLKKMKEEGTDGASLDKALQVGIKCNGHSYGPKVIFHIFSGAARRIKSSLTKPSKWRPLKNPN